MNPPLNLTWLRKHQRLTQAEMAATLEVPQPSVSRTERQDDLLLSSLARYVAATGGRLRLVASYPDGREVSFWLADV